VVGDEEDQRVRIRIGEILPQRLELGIVLAAPIERLHAAHEKNLEGRHERRRKRLVQDFLKRSLFQVELVQAEVAEFKREQMFEHSLAALPAEKGLIAGEDVSRLQFAFADIGNKALDYRESLQKASRTLLTSERAKSRQRRSNAGSCSSKKLETCSEAWYSSRNK